MAQKQLTSLQDTKLLGRAYQSPSRFQNIAKFFRGYPGAALGATILLLAVLISLSSPLFEETAYRQQLAARLQPPAWSEAGDRSHLLGTDGQGRDMLTRLGIGIRISLMVGVAAVAVSGTIGLVVGLTAGYFGGFVDDVLMRIVDMLLAIPVVLLAITILSFVPSGLATVIAVIAFTQWVVYARASRAETLTIREREFVEGAIIAGGTGPYIVRKHILPNVLPTMIALATLNVSVVILIEAGLSFLGLGVQPPMPSLGGMLSDGRGLMERAPTLAVLPGLTLVILILGVNLFGDGLRAYLDPRTYSSH